MMFLTCFQVLMNLVFLLFMMKANLKSLLSKKSKSLVVVLFQVR